MTEQLRKHQRARRHRRALRPENFYEGVLQESDAALAAAAGATGLTDELALLRVLVRRQIEEHPDRLDQTIRALHLLVRMVAVQFRLSGDDQQRLRDSLDAVVQQLTAAVLGEEEQRA